ncbi:MAG TPA: GAF domain-containing sensor histidine kinase [Nitrospira sp.]|nr:GAF domain-containing sensor histidine kinase [Nitrospira sp.]
MVLSESQVQHLIKRLDRERRARAESEAIAEKALGDLYRRQEEVKLLQMIAVAANQTSMVQNAMQFAIDAVCADTGWPVGHVYFLSEDGTGELASGKLWHLESPERFKRFRDMTEVTDFKAGVGLPGQVLSSGKPLWVTDITKDRNFPRSQAAEAVGLRAAFAFPVLIGQEVVGVLEFFSADPSQPDEALLEVMAHVGTQLGRVIERKRGEEALLQNTTRLEQALAENVRLYEDIKLQKNQLEIANKHKSQFLANMSHELRTPLNAILGYTQLILSNIYGDVPAKISEILQRISVSGHHLLSLINDVLDLSKIEAGQLQLVIKEYSIGDVVQDVLTTMEPLAEQKRLALKANIPLNLPLGSGNAGRIKQVLLNLVGNAIKFTDHGEVSVEVCHGEDRFIVQVSDTGPGIDPVEQQRIFEEFQQGDRSRTRKKGGTGLGLTIAKQIVKLHGGRLWVESTVGQGSTFSFSLPRRFKPSG